jgi:hypothetical protein
MPEIFPVWATRNDERRTAGNWWRLAEGERHVLDSAASVDRAGDVLGDVPGTVHRWYG